MNLSKLSETRKNSIIESAERMGFDVRVDEDTTGLSIVCNHRNGVVSASVTVNENGRNARWSVSAVDAVGNDLDVETVSEVVRTLEYVARAADDKPRDTANAEDALRSIAAHPSSALRTWYSPEVLEQGIQLVSARYSYELFPSEVAGLASELVRACYDLRAQELKADRKAGIKHDVDQILAAHAASPAVSETYTDGEVAEAVRVVRKRQGQTTIDPHWVRMKLEQELREARAKAEESKDV